MNKQALAEAIINECGGAQAVAAVIGAKTPSVVMNWRTRGIPAGWLAYLREKFPHLRAWTLAPAQEVPHDK